MLRLNIISNKLKKEIRLQKIHHNLKNVYGLIIISMAIFIIALLVGKFILQNAFIRTTEKTSNIIRSTENYSRQVSIVNAQIKAVNKIQNEHIEWSYLVNYLDKLREDGLVLNRISLNKEKGSLEITGHARQRETLLDLKETLEKQEIFSAVNFPISNFLKKEDINFNLSCQIDNYEFSRL